MPASRLMAQVGAVHLGLCFSTMDYTIKVIDMADQVEVTNIEGHPSMFWSYLVEVWKVRFWKDRLVTAGDQGKVFVYDPSTGELVNDYKFGDAFVTAIAVNAQNDIVLANSNGEIGMFGDGAFNPMPTEHKKYIRAMSYMYNNSQLVLASDDLRISVIDL
jgi:WD40 repeat protein